MKKFQIRNGFIPSDRGHTSLIEITKWLWLFAADHSQNVASCVAPLLHSHGRDSGQGLSSLMRKIGEVTNDLHFRMSRNSEVVVHNNSDNAVNRYAERFPDERGNITCHPNVHADRHNFDVHYHTL